MLPTGLLGILGIAKEFLKKVPWWVYPILVVLIAGYLYRNKLVGQIKDLKADIVNLVTSNRTLVQINDSLSVIVTTDADIKDSLTASLDAAKELNAELLAASKITLTPDTVFVESIESDNESVDQDTGIRSAKFTDTTKAGILDATIRVPPLPQPITMTYNFKPAAIEFEFSLLRTTDDNIIFGLTYTGGQTQIEYPYAKLPKRRPHLIGYIEGGYQPVDDYPFARLGMRWHPFWKIYTFGELQHNLNTSTVNKDFTKVFFGLGFNFYER